jgi:ribonuclease BN (tRNA processing enzyme)
MYTRHDDFESRLRAQQQPPYFPAASWDEMRAERTFVQMSDEPLTLCAGRVRVTTLELDHPARAWAYRFEADDKVFVYASDGAYFNLDDKRMQPYADFYRDADLLIFDAQFTLAESLEKRTWGHSSAIVGVELACSANVKNLALFHHDPGADDAQLERLMQVGMQYTGVIPCGPCNVFLAREGETIQL